MRSSRTGRELSAAPRPPTNPRWTLHMPSKETRTSQRKILAFPVVKKSPALLPAVGLSCKNFQLLAAPGGTSK